MLSFIKETRSCWESLKEEKRPIYIYGMGNGALKIMSAFKQYGIPLAGVFASDDFVRGHEFEGYRVQKLSEIEKTVEDFVVVLAFGVCKQPMIEKIESLALKYKVYVPDVPVAGNGLFTYEYCVEHQEELERVYNLLADNFSRKVFADVINFKISGDMKYLKNNTTSRSDVYQGIIKPSKVEVFVDLGAYNGDTIKELLSYTGGSYSEIYAVEPDKKNFKKLLRSIEGKERITAKNAVAWCIDTEIQFAAREGRQSSVSASGSKMPAISVDSMLEGKKATLIKMDVEGSETEAIWGACHTIAHHTPKLMISLYHRNEDIFSIPLLINSFRSDYRLYIRRQQYLPAWETNLYAVL